MTQKKYYYELDILRGIGCLLVFFCHLPIYEIYKPLSFFSGANGVILFFVISGFIISKTFGDKLIHRDVKSFSDWTSLINLNQELIYKFWHRRYLRIAPAYLLLILCTFIATIRFSMEYGNVIDSIIGFIKYVNKLFFLEVNGQRFSNNMQYPIPELLVLGLIWSINTEILFYFAFPFVAVLKRFKECLPQTIITLIALKFIICCFVPYNSIHGNIFMHFDDFFLGVLIGYYHNDINLSAKIIQIIVPIALINLIIASEITLYNSYIQALISSTILVYIAATDQGILKFPILGRILNFIGRRSYFIYMMHTITDYFLWVPFKTWFNLFASYTNIVINNPVLIDHYRHIMTFLLVILLADLFYRYIESGVLLNKIRNTTTKTDLQK
jgi:peptidoglycan/LPS O-acetylase OafA/YrhL